MSHRLSLRQQNALRLTLIFILFEILSGLAVVFLLMLPMAERATSDLTGLMVLSAQTWSELPPGTRPAFEQELFRAHGLSLIPSPPADATPMSIGGPYLRALEARLAERTGETIELLQITEAGERWLWAGLPAPSRTLWLGFPSSRVGPHPIAAASVVVISGFLLAALAAWWLGGYILTPIRRFDAAAAALGRGDTPTLLPERGPRELAGLAHRFNRLSGQIHDLLESRTTLLAGLSHDLRTPLARMRLALEMLQRRPAPTWIERMEQDIGEMDQLIGEVLTLARGLGHSPSEPIQLAALLDELAEPIRAAGTQVEVQCPRLELHAPATALRRVLANLLDNARRYAGDHPLALRAQSTDGGCRIGVLDRGSGIPATELETVFRPFHRLEHSRNRDTGGTGLGLAIVKQLAQAHGWRIWLENRPSGGLAAWVELPLGDETKPRPSAN